MKHNENLQQNILNTERRKLTMHWKLVDMMSDNRVSIHCTSIHTDKTTIQSTWCFWVLFCYPHSQQTALIAQKTINRERERNVEQHSWWWMLRMRYQWKDTESASKHVILVLNRLSGNIVTSSDLQSQFRINFWCVKNRFPF